MRIFSEGGDGTMWAFFPSASHFLLPQLLFQQLCPCPAFLAKLAVSFVAQGTAAPSQPPSFTAHFPIDVTGKICSRGGKVHVDNLSMHIHPYLSKKKNQGTQGLQRPGKVETLLLWCHLEWGCLDC